MPNKRTYGGSSNITFQPGRNCEKTIIQSQIRGTQEDPCIHLMHGVFLFATILSKHGLLNERNEKLDLLILTFIG